MSSTQTQPLGQVSKVEDMIALLSKVRHRLRHRYRRPLQDTEPGVGRIDRGKRRADHAHQVRHETTGHRASPPLPEIVDRGPPALKRYANDDVFWNSVMVEADIDPTKRPARAQKAVEPAFRKNAVVGPASNLRERYKMQEVEPSRSKSGTLAPSTQRPNKARVHDDEAIDRKTGENDARDQNNHQNRSSPLSDAAISSSASSQVSPKTVTRPKHRDNKTDMSTRSRDRRGYERHRSSEGNMTARSVVVPEVKAQEAKPQRTTTPPSTFPFKPSSWNQSVDNETLQTTSKVPNEEVVTWNSAFNKILAYESVDSSMKQKVRERVREITTAKGDVRDDRKFVTFQEAGLVPKFSYPIVASPFCDRVYAQQNPPRSMNTGIEPPKREKSNPPREERQDTPQAQCPHSREEDSLSHNEEEEEAAAAAAAAEEARRHDHDDLYDITPSSSSRPSSSSPSRHSSDIETPPYARQTTEEIIKKAPERLKSALKEALTPSELDLYTHAIDDPSSVLSRPPSPFLRAENFDINTMQMCLRVILSVYGAMLGLQEDILHHELRGIPELGSWLERKMHQIRFLEKDIERLDVEGLRLRQCVNLALVILDKCCERECELARSLRDLRRRERDGCKACEGHDAERRHRQIHMPLVLLAERNELALKEDLTELMDMVKDFNDKYGELGDVKFREVRWADEET